MIWPFLFVLLFVIFRWGRIYGTYFNFPEILVGYFFDTLFLGLISAFLFTLGSGLGSLIGLAVPKHWVATETTQLISLRNSDGVSGDLFLGTGSIGATQYYFFYQKDGKGYRQGKVAINDNAVVFEEKRQDGELKTYTYQFVDPSLRWIAIDLQNKKKYEFTVPEGSLHKESFVLQ
ncbi:MAG: hypothetical protein HYT28_03825 [Parcubacteria group bacterium]|nr:hypothetical protein [Parcubacteria group bacterium]